MKWVLVYLKPFPGGSLKLTALASVVFLLMGSFAQAALVADPTGETITEKVKADMPILSAILAPGEDLAGAYVTQTVAGQPPVRHLAGDDYLFGIASSYIRADFNQDGRIDLAIITEAAPGTSADKLTAFGDRTLKIYLAD